MSRPVRVRFAPSPTGPLHIGGVRTALFNYLFAKKNNGVFYLRIEDTDQNRFVPGAEQYIFEALEWLGIAPSETVGKNEKFGPYRQSERKEIYKQYADQLIQTGWAYYAFDTPEALDFHRKQHEEQGKTFIYNWHNREKLDTSLVISKEETDRRIVSGEEYVIRFKTPVNEVLELKDIIRGDIKFDTNLLDDKVLFKSDGMPTYHLANIVDDHLMETSHVIRGEEWLPSLPLHYLLYKAFGWEAPEFAHLPLILKPIGNGKLSKRDGDKMGFPVFPLEWKTDEGISSGYREKGFFPEAVINFLALLGWNDGTDQELFSLEELAEKFDLNRVHKAGAKFDPEKNKWFNHQYLQKQSDEELAESLKKILINKNILFTDDVYNYKLANEVYLKMNVNLDGNLIPSEVKAIVFSDQLITKNLKKTFIEKSTLHNKPFTEDNNTIDENEISESIKNEMLGKVNCMYFSNAPEQLISNKEIRLGKYKLCKVKKNYNFIDDENIAETTKIIEVISLIKERANFVSDFWELADYFFVAPTSYDEKAVKNWKEETTALMKQVIQVLEPINDYISLNIENKLKTEMSKQGIGIGKVMQPLRLSLVGALKGPHLFDIMELIGKEETVKRIEKAIKTL